MVSFCHLYVQIDYRQKSGDGRQSPSLFITPRDLLGSRDHRKFSIQLGLKRVRNFETGYPICENRTVTG